MVRPFKVWRLSGQFQERIPRVLVRTIMPELLPAPGGAADLQDRESGQNMVTQQGADFPPDAMDLADQQPSPPVVAPGMDLLVFGITGSRLTMATQAMQSLVQIIAYDTLIEQLGLRPETAVLTDNLQIASEAAHSWRMSTGEAAPQTEPPLPGQAPDVVNGRVDHASLVYKAHLKLLEGLQSAAFEGALALGHALLGGIPPALDSGAIYMTYTEYLQGTSGYGQDLLYLATASLTVCLTYAASIREKNPRLGWGLLGGITAAQALLRATLLTTQFDMGSLLLFALLTIPLPFLAIVAHPRITAAAGHLRLGVQALRTALDDARELASEGRLELHRIRLREMHRQAEFYRLAEQRRQQQELAQARLPKTEAKAAAYEALVIELAQIARDQRDEIVAKVLTRNAPEIRVVARLLAECHVDQQEEDRKRRRQAAYEERNGMRAWGFAHPDAGRHGNGRTTHGMPPHAGRHPHPQRRPDPAVRALLPAQASGNGHRDSETPWS